MPKLKQKNKIIVGVTGSFGSGKSAVSGILASYGAKVIDADKIAADCLRRGSRAYKKAILTFGKGIVGKDRNIDRLKLARIVFNDKKLLKKLNRIIHPEVKGIIKARINSEKKGVIVLDAPLLLEAGLKNAVDKLIVVIIDPDAQIRRLVKKTLLKKADILKRIRFQIPQNVKSHLADFIIDNSGSLQRTKKQVAQIKEELWKS